MDIDPQLERHAARPLAHTMALAILEGFDEHYREFRALSARGRALYEGSRWTEGRANVVARLNAYDASVKSTADSLVQRFARLDDDALWRDVKRAFIDLLAEHRQPECAETFYNSVACRLLERRYYRNEYIFFRPARATDYLDGSTPAYRCAYPKPGELARCLRELLEGLGVRCEYQNLERDTRYLERAFREQLPAPLLADPCLQIHTLRAAFFRNRAAYIVGRAVIGDHLQPFVIPVLKDRQGRIFADTVLFDAKSIGRVFSLARAYFMVDMEVPAAHVEFLRTLLPTKSAAEIYVMLGLYKHGKTLFYRDLQHHLGHSTDSFVLAQGARGMVMLVFTLPSFPYVFKVIRDWFDPPKQCDRAEVRAKYAMVKYHDRVGRMADSLEYSNVGLPRHRFDPAVLTELKRLAPSMIEEDGDTLVIRHVYIERRMTPLDVFMRRASRHEQHEAIAEFGDALRDLATANIFPGDLLLKNFGITRHGKIASYDYDEIAYLTELNFRDLPAKHSYEEELAEEPWFAVGPRDVFPEEWPRFLFSNQETRALFYELHGELATARFWLDAQARARSGEERSVYPYARALRFRHRYREDVP